MTMTTTPEAPMSAIVEHAVQLTGVGKTFGHGRRAVTALENMDLQVAAGEFVCGPC
jgi:NitT/TauT family transport system ATP-binding protein